VIISLYLEGDNFCYIDGSGPFFYRGGVYIPLKKKCELSTKLLLFHQVNS
jgi:hypothetical protein